jgi:uncharacterized tellurite resistance protein B-like protein
MGLFDMFKGDKAFELNPYSVFVTSMLYIIAADGEVNENEIGQLIATVGGNQAKGVDLNELLKGASKYVRATSIDAFLAEAAPKLNKAQQICILINIIDTLFADGNAAKEEQEMFAKFLSAFGESEESFASHFETIVTKNKKSVFFS